MNLPSAPVPPSGLARVPPLRAAFHKARGTPLTATLIALAYAAIFAREGGPRAAIEFDRDEGFSLMKAMLVNQGHSLYSEIWSDQPPGYTYLIAGFTRLCGETPEVARLITIFLASLTLGCVYELCRAGRGNLAGHLAGLSGALALVMSAGFVRYSVPVMVTLPSVAFATFAGLLLSRADAPSRSRSALSGFVFGLGLAVKLIIAPVLPAFLVLLWKNQAREARALLRSALPFALGGALALLCCFGPFLGRGLFESLIGAHVEGARGLHYSSVGKFLGADVYLFSLAALGAALSFRAKAALFALCWLLLSTLALSRHEPIWDHHRILITVPAAVLAGTGIGSLASSALSASATKMRSASQAALFAVAILLVAWASFRGASRVAPALREFRLPEAYVSTADAIRSHAPQAKWAVTSNQMYAYRLGIPVPPNLAVTSSKRWTTGQLTAADLREAMRTYKPEVVILTNRWDDKVRKALVKKELRSYDRVYRDSAARELEVYVRTDSTRP